MIRDIRTVGQLVSALGDYPPETRVLLALQPAYPLAATIRAIAHSPDDADMTDRGAPTAWEPVVWIGESEHTGYLPEIARDALDMT
jgi:hypothetical protein